MHSFFINRKVAKHLAFLGLMCFVLFKAIVPSGFMFASDARAGVVLCHGDNKSHALMSQLHAEQSVVSNMDSIFGLSEDSLSSPANHDGATLCDYSVLQLLIFSFVALLFVLAFFQASFVCRYFPVVIPSLYVHGLSRAPPI